MLKPILLFLTSLSIIWDFGVFAQPYLLIGSSHIDRTNYLMGVYVFIEGYAKHDFGRGAAISLLMLMMIALLSVRLCPPDGARRSCRVKAAHATRQTATLPWNILGLLVFVVMIFPVYGCSRARFSRPTS